MRLLSDFAYGFYVGPLPMIAVVGFVTYGLFLMAAGIMVSRRWLKRFARRAFTLHRWLATGALVLATLHLLMGLSSYV
jgi:hypothetical protein